MIDDTFRVYMIEANTNPCLEVSCQDGASECLSVCDKIFPRRDACSLAGRGLWRS